MMRFVAVALLLLLGAGFAWADPVVDRVDAKLSRNRRLKLKIDATFTGSGELRVEGTVNGREVSFRKRVRKASTRRMRVRVDARKLKLRRITEALDFDLNVIAEETTGARAERRIERTVAVPLIVLPGLGNEVQPQAGEALVAALDLAGADYETEGRTPNLVLREYPSLEGTLRQHARKLDKTVRRTLRGSTFGRVDVVGYSMGGLVARRWIDGRGAKRARRVVFLGTPNQGAPLAQLAALGLQGDALSGIADLVAPDLGDLGFVSDLIGGVVDAESTVETLRTFYPTYAWAFVTVDIPLLGPQRVALTPELIQNFGGFVPELAAIPLDFESPLAPLNDAVPPEDVGFFAIGYSDVLPGATGFGIGTVDEIDLTGLLDGEGFDPLELASGEGDGLVPWRSLILDDEPLWRDAVTATDLGAGTHIALPTDPRAIARILEILAE